ncbi:hypothetical protein PIB30_041834 [Stylosanthes scabra]|uniref:Replication factor A C-terminal domain-containing protein n=1 Tax=Stylosanthes scabra TaxID=79078 RepID=A0ABU6RFG6_9FABA|nr:hypothetical protein [Stylosanthes scabra]
MFNRHGSSVEEFKMYVMSKFIIVDKKLKTRAAENNWTLTFSHMTIVEPVAEPSFPLEPFWFHNIAELLTADVIDGSQLIEIIAEVVGKEEPRELTTVGGRDTKRLALKIQDLEKNTIEAVLFGGLVDQIQPHMDDGRVEPLIVVLQFFRPNRWKGKTSVQSHFETSRLLIDPNLSDVKEFRTRLLGDQPCGSVRITQVSSQGGSTGIAELRRGTAEVKTIEQVMVLGEEGQVWIAGHIESINAGMNDWSYPACNDCLKKVEQGEDGRYTCKKHEDTTNLELKYKVEVMVCDGTRGISLLMWDTQIIHLCSKSADDVKMEAVITKNHYFRCRVIFGPQT